MKRSLTVKDFLNFTSAEDILSFLTEKKAKYLGRGSSRIVYRISPRRVIKVAYDSTWIKKGAGKAQNKREVEVNDQYGDSGLFARVIWYHPRYLWLISEFAQNLEKAGDSSFPGEDFFEKHKRKLNNWQVLDLYCPTAFGKIGKKVVVRDYGFDYHVRDKFY